MYCYSLGSSSQSGTLLATEEAFAFGERVIEDSSDVSDRSSSSSDCKISCADKVDFKVLLENTLLVVLAERTLAAVGEVFGLFLRLDGILVEMA